MSRLIKLVLAASILVPSVTLAAGYHAKGNVDVHTFPTYVMMQANMSVRYNTTAAGSPYVYSAGYAGGTVSFHGRDGSNEYFSCYVYTTNPLYQAAVDIKNNLQDGSRLYVTRDINGSECTNISLGNYSYAQE